MQPNEAPGSVGGDRAHPVLSGPDAGETWRIDAVRACLDAVRDPELDEPVTAMGFIQAIEVRDGAVGVTFQLPTAWCAANFAYLMAVDIKAAIVALPWVRAAEVVLLEHFAARRINDAVNRDLSFVEAFPNKAERELDDLRRTFVEKAFLARQNAVIEALSRAEVAAAAGWSVGDLERWVAGSPEHGVAVARYLALRRTLPGSAAFVTERGAPVPSADWPAHRREIRRTAMTIAANAEHCRMLAEARQA
jgi:metal-sulfur cluster biosynthetic enzyme